MESFWGGLRPMSRRRIVFVVLLLAVLGAGTVAIDYREEIRLELLREQAIEELAAEKFNPRELPETLADVLRSKRTNSAVLARILSEPDLRTWSRLVCLIDRNFSEEERDELISYLRDDYTLALVRYLLFEPYSSASAWRRDTTPSWQGGSRFLEERLRFWTGSVRGSNRATRAAVDFLESILDGRFEYERARPGLLLAPQNASHDSARVDASAQRIARGSRGGVARDRHGADAEPPTEVSGSSLKLAVASIHRGIPVHADAYSGFVARNT